MTESGLGVFVAELELKLEAMRESDLEAVARFHQEVGGNQRIVADALRFEYFDNPDPGSALYLSRDATGRVVASQAFISQSLVRGDERHLTLMSERTLLDPSLRGKVGFRDFYVAGLERSCAEGPVEFVWGGTAAVKAFQRFGFDTYDCFFESILVLSFAPIVGLLVDRASTIKQKVFYGLAYAGSWAKGLARRRAWSRAGRDVRIDSGHPGSKILTGFLRDFRAAHPGSFFMDYSEQKLDWIARRNAFRDREIFLLYAGKAISGLAIVERESSGIASIVELLILDDGAIDIHCAALANHLKRHGFGAARFWGNAENPYLARLRTGLSTLGAVPLPVRAQLVLRRAGASSGPYPAVSELAMTSTWGPPV